MGKWVRHLKDTSSKDLAKFDMFVTVDKKEFI